MPGRVINVAYYITGHGLGHATRSLELMRGLLRTRGFRVFSVSTVPESFLRNELSAGGLSLVDDAGEPLFEHFERDLDSGAVQVNATQMDTVGTLEKYLRAVHAKRDALLEFEVSWLRERKVDVVLLDATPLGSLAGRLAGTRVVFVTNFTWDFVFREMIRIVRSLGLAASDQCERFEEMAKQCEEDVCSCDHIIHYPGQTPLPPGFVASKIIGGPLLSRTVCDAKLRAKFCSPTEHLLLLGFGGFTVDWKLQDSFLPDGWRCIVLRAGSQQLPSRFLTVPDDSYIPDLIYAADVVLGKIGYGFVSECLTAGTPLVYVPRSHWPEEAYLEHTLVSEYNAGLSIPLQDYEEGNWSPYLEKALAKKGSWTLPIYRDDAGRVITATEKTVCILQGLLGSLG